MRTSIALCACLALVAAPAAAQQAFYPAKHQSKATQEKDRGHCDEWAVKQSGFNPAYAYAPQKKTGAVAKGALIGGVKQHNENKKAQKEHDAKQASYDNAFSACMKGRGYTTAEPAT